MSYASLDAVKTAMQSPAFIERVMADLRAQAAAEHAFEQSATFKRMLDAIRGTPHPVLLSNEHFQYCSEDCKREVGWEFVSDDEVQLFFSVMANPQGSAVEPGSLVVDTNCMFDNAKFQHYGLNVFTLFGLDVLVWIRKD